MARSYVREENRLDFKDYYKTLEVDKKASADVIQRAYRKLARKFHPDVNQAPGAEDRFKEISEAYEVLKDPERRKTYDRFGRDVKRSGGQPPPGWENIGFDFGGGGGGSASGFSSFFENMFGGGRRGGGGGFGFDFGGLNMDDARAGRAPGGRQAGGADQEARLVLSLEEAARGGQRELSLTDPVTGGMRNHKVNLPAGVRPGQRIRLPGRGARGISGGAGDLYLKVEVKPHPKFRLDGSNLHTTVRVTPWEAALGAEVPVATLDGPVTIRVPGGTSGGRKIRLKGKGFPAPKGPTGDLYAEIEIVVPKTLSDQERTLFEALAEASSFRAR